MTLREYTGNAVPSALAASIGVADTSVSITVATGWPVGALGPFFFTLSAGQVNEERCLATTRTGNMLNNVLRGQDGTSAVAHNVGETAAHTFSATDAREANAHVNATSGVHGVTSQLVGVSDAQSLTNKTLVSPTISNPVITGETESEVINLVTDLAQREKVFGIAPGLVGTPPSVATGGFLMQAGTTVSFTNGSGGYAVSFPAAFPNGVVTVVAMCGDNAGGPNLYTTLIASANTVSGFQGVINSASGPVASSNVRINYIAIGF